MVYDLYFTTERIIVISIQHPGDVQNSDSWVTFLFGGWINRRSDQFEQDKLSKERRNLAQRSTPAELLGQNPHNFEIPSNIIKSIEISRKLFQWQIRFHVSHPEIVRRTHFSLNQNQVAEARRLVGLILPTRPK
jgi:hypothetical protein